MAGLFDFIGGGIGKMFDPFDLFGGGGDASLGSLPGLPGMPGGSEGGFSLPGMDFLSGGEGGSGMPGLPGMGGSGGGMGGIMDMMNPMSMFGGGSGGGSGGGLVGALTGSEAIYGKKPNLLTAPSPTDIALGAANANLAVQPQNQLLASRANAFSQAQRAGMLRSGITGYDDIQNTRASIIRDELAGLVPVSDAAQQQNSVAARAISGGFGGTPAHGNLLARDLNLMSREQQQRGMNDAGNYLQQTANLAVPSMFSTAGFYLNPSYDPYGMFKNELYNENIKAAPIPSAAGAAAAQQALLESVLAAYSGTPKSALTDPRSYNSGSQAAPNFSYGGGGGGGYGGSYGSYSPGYQSPTAGVDYNPGNAFDGSDLIG